MSLTYTCLDTMKISRDDNFATQSMIQGYVAQYAGLGLTHLTVASFLDGSLQPDSRIEDWANSIHDAGYGVWWRPGYDSYGATPAAMKSVMLAFPTRRYDLFRSGDIYDMGPEQSPFVEYNGTPIFGSTIPDMVAAWNPWVIDVKNSLDSLFASHSLSVVTGITSLTEFVAKHYVDAATYAAFGYATIDGYPADGANPYQAAQEIINTLVELHTVSGVPVIVGETGISHLPKDVDKTYQRDVLRCALNGIAKLSFVVGMNYWVGHGFDQGGSLILLENGVYVPLPGLTTIGEFYRNGECRDRLVVV